MDKTDSLNHTLRRIGFAALLLLCSLAALAQGKLASKVNLDESKATVETVLKKIERQTGLSVIISAEQARKMPLISITAHGRPVRQVLEEIAGKAGCAYRVSGEIITFFKPSTRVLKGVVTDENGEPLIGVYVAMGENRSLGITDSNGRFSVTIPTTHATVRFSYVGMKAEIVNLPDGVKNVSRNITLRNGVKLDDVVVTGLMNYNAKTFTGNASVYGGEELKTVGHQNLIKSLALLDPSLAITENIEAGSDPNKNPQIHFRGETSFQGFENIDPSGLVSDPNQPLFILDGYQTTIDRIIDLDMNRVESVTILKDAAAGAIYGARAANGVIVVKTKRPKEGQLKVSYNLDLDFNLPDLSSYNMLDAKGNLDLINRLGLYRETDGTLRPEYNQIAKWVAQGVNTDWMSKPLRNAVGNKHSLNLQGGDQRMRYGVDLNYSNVPGVMKESKRDNYGIGVDLSYNCNDRLLFSNYLNVYQSHSKESPYGSFSDYTLINPYFPETDANGKYNKYYYYTDEYGNQNNIWGNVNNIPVNPLYEAHVGNEQKASSLNVSENFSFDWRILESLRFNGRLSYTKVSSKATQFVSPNSATYSDYGSSSSMGDVTADEDMLRGKYTYTQTDQQSIEGNAYLTWSQLFGKHFITASVGASLSDSKSVVYGFVAQGFGSEDNHEPAYAQGYEKGGTPQNAEGHARLASFFGSANYAYDNRYLADLSYRLDGSSSFGSKEKTAPFYSVGLGWNAHNEKFVKKLKFINLLRLRATYGEMGSVNFAPYQAKDIYTLTSSSRYDGNIGAVLQGLGNANLRWQNTKSRELGVTIGVLNRIDLGLSVYRKDTKDMVLPVTLPPSSGFASFTENLGKMRNDGWELTVRGFVVKKPKFNVALFANASHNKNRILAISSSLESYNRSIDSSDGMTADQYKQASHKFLTKYEEGRSTTAIYAVRSLGIDPMTGEELFLDRDGKPTYTWNAKDKVVVGDTEPKVRGTFGANVGWKGLYLNLTFSYQMGGQAYNQTLVDKVENSNKYKNVDKRVLTETWQKPGDVTSYKANVTSRYSNYYTYASSRFVQDLDILQLSALSLQYELPKSWIKPLRIESLRLSFNTSDLMYLSTVKRERGTSYPFQRSFTFGLRANF